MATNADTPSPFPIRPARRRKPFTRFRHWVQAAFLLVWLSPAGVRWMTIPGCVFHCYNCPLATLACPVGIVAQFSALHVLPALALGVVIALAGLTGSLVCGWSCPFGFLQDLLNKIPVPKVRIPNFLGYVRYAVIAVMVVGVPYVWGNSHPLFICRQCPAGAIEGGIGWMIRDALSGKTPTNLAPTTWIIIGVFLTLAMFAYRPWCKVLCPLGGFLSLFNRHSVFHLEFRREACIACNTCRSRCSMGVPVEQSINNFRCIRCMECTNCGAVGPNVNIPGWSTLPPLPGKKDAESQRP